MYVYYITVTDTVTVTLFRRYMHVYMPSRAGPHCMISGQTEITTDRQTTRQTDNKTDRQQDRQTDRHTTRQTDNKTDRQTNAYSWCPCNGPHPRPPGFQGWCTLQPEVRRRSEATLRILHAMFALGRSGGCWLRMCGSAPGAGLGAGRRGCGTPFAIVCWMYVCIHVDTDVILIHMYIYRYTHIHTYIYIHTYTYTFIHLKHMHCTKSDIHIVMTIEIAHARLFNQCAFDTKANTHTHTHTHEQSHHTYEGRDMSFIFLLPSKWSYREPDRDRDHDRDRDRHVPASWKRGCTCLR